MKKHSGIFQFITFFFGLGFMAIGSLGYTEEYVGITLFFFSVGVFLLWKKSFYYGKAVYVAYWVWGVILLVDGIALLTSHADSVKTNMMDYSGAGSLCTIGGIILIIRALLHKKWGLIGTEIKASKEETREDSSYGKVVHVIKSENRVSSKTSNRQYPTATVSQEPTEGKKKKYSMEDIDHISSLKGTKMKGDFFEQYCARLLEKNMFSNVQVVGGSGDLGADIIAWKANKKYVVQCKCYNNKVPYHALEQAATARRNVAASQAIIMTNNYFSEQTKRIAPELQVLLWDRDTLAKLIDNANEVTTL